MPTTWQNSNSAECAASACHTLVGAAGAMFSLVFQRGPSVEVFVPKGHNPTKGWLLGGHVKKAFDKAVRG